MKPGGGRAKGHAFERWCATRLREIYPDAKRGLQGRGGAEAPDVDIPQWWVECKVGLPARYHIDALAQAERDAIESGDKRVPVAVCKLDRREPTATMRLSALWGAPTADPLNGIAVTMHFADWLAIVADGAQMFAPSDKDTELRGKQYKGCARGRGKR